MTEMPHRHQRPSSKAMQVTCGLLLSVYLANAGAQTTPHEPPPPYPSKLHRRLKHGNN